MKNYSKENTVAVLVKDRKILASLKTVCKRQQLMLYSIEKPTDIIAVPCFLTIIEKKWLDGQYVEMLEELSLEAGDNEWKLHLIGTEKIKTSQRLKKHTHTIEVCPSNLDMEKIINDEKKTFIKGIKRASLINNKIYRIVKLYIDVTKNGNLLDIESYTALNLVSERTLRRDIRVLKDLFPDFIVYYKNGWKS
jgi:hypothetical protein